MERKLSDEEETENPLVKGQAEIWKLMFGFAESMALKSAVQLGIADIIHSHGCPISLSQLASGIDSPSPDLPYLSRIMRFLVHKQIFTSHKVETSHSHFETLYGLNDVSKWLVQTSDQNLSPMVLMENHPLLLSPWHHLAQCVKEGGLAFEKAHGCQIWELGSRAPELNRVFNDGLASTAKVVMRAFLSGYRVGLEGVGSLVDVGGGTGGSLVEIVRAYPHVRGVNFDLPHVVETAPDYEGVQHVGGDMFKEVPNGDAIFMKWLLHDWGDEYCVEILKNCRKSIPEKTGKLILIEIVLPAAEDDGDDQQEKNQKESDFGEVMFAHGTGGKERTEHQWKTLLQKGGFPRYRIIKIAALPSIIEAYPL
ncbi:(R,S)-reticuline 7-O-methyltransferase [Linum perenne]